MSPASQQLDRRALIGRADAVGADVQVTQHAVDALDGPNIPTNPQQQNDS